MNTTAPAAGRVIDTETETFRDWLAANARAVPDKPAIVAIDQAKSFTWGEVHALCNRMARWLADRGIGGGDRVVLLSDNVIETALLFLGILRRGAAVCPIDIESSGAQARELIARLEPKLVLWRPAAVDAALRAGLPGEWVPFDSYPSAPAAAGGDDLFARLAAVPALPEVPFVGRPDDESVIGFTSGTSAAPKGVVHHYDSYPKVPEACVVLWGVTPDDRLLEYRSFAWASTHTLSLVPAVMAGATVAMARKFSHSRFFDWIAAQRPTIILGIPAVVNMFLNRRVDIDRSILAGVRFMSCSTAPLHEAQLRAFEDAYGIPLVQHYGMSEGGMLAGNRPWDRRIGTVGRPCIYQDMRIVDEDGRDLPPGQTGEIQISGPQIAFGYLLEDRSITPIRDKPLRTGDLGHFDPDGCLHITGRAKDLIIRGGVNISPMEVEQALITHPGIAEAAAVGVPDPVFGEAVIAYVVRRDPAGPDEAAVIAHGAAALAPTKRPKAVAFIDAIPRNDRGKIDRNALAALWRRDNPE